MPSRSCSPRDAPISGNVGQFAGGSPADQPVATSRHRADLRACPPQRETAAFLHHGQREAAARCAKRSRRTTSAALRAKRRCWTCVPARCLRRRLATQPLARICLACRIAISNRKMSALGDFGEAGRFGLGLGQGGGSAPISILETPPVVTDPEGSRERTFEGKVSGNARLYVAGTGGGGESNSSARPAMSMDWEPASHQILTDKPPSDGSTTAEILQKVSLRAPRQGSRTKW